LLKDRKKYFYFDSFGFPASSEIEDQIGEYIYSTNQIQDINSSSCGYFCIAFMMWMQEHKHKNKEICFNSFLDVFSKDTKKNELILNKLLN
jgi:hypothetical protein